MLVEPAQGRLVQRGGDAEGKLVFQVPPCPWVRAAVSEAQGVGKKQDVTVSPPTHPRLLPSLVFSLALSLHPKSLRVRSCLDSGFPSLSFFPSTP